MSIFANQEKSFNTVECKDRLGGQEEMTSNTLAYFFKNANISSANKLLFDSFHTMLRAKQLDDFFSVNGLLALVIDGTQCFESTIKHVDNCTEVVRNGVTYYQYRLLIASAVNIKTHDTIVVSIEPILNRDGSQKNDCEINAAKRLLARINKYNPWMRYLILADGLYTAAPIIKQIKSYKWEAVATLTDERMSVFKEAQYRFDIRNHDAFYTENYENNYLWYESNSMSAFWESLDDLPIYIGKRKIEQINKDGSIKKNGKTGTTFFVSTIQLNGENVKNLSKAQRARWGIENTTINNLKNIFLMKHVFVYKGTAIIWIFASLVMNLFTVFRLRNRIKHTFKKMSDEAFRNNIAQELGGHKMFENIFILTSTE